MIVIHKSHSKTDLIDLINYLGLNIIFNHSNNKKELHQKMNDFMETTSDRFFQSNHFHIDTPSQLKGYLIRTNPKKTLSIKEKQDVMGISKSIICYAQSGYDIHMSQTYKDTQTILDDMLYIKNFGDIPSVRRACRLMIDDPKFQGQHFDPLISPQVLNILAEKEKCKKPPLRYRFVRKTVILTFD
tara:strand:+ start:260 stop:817 length:558 start_codon:yes stop_codon:yes gene_type:complete